MQYLHRTTNHPVHIFDEKGNPSPSAFIPFCQFGRNISTLGSESDLFSIPVCNGFKAKLFYDQLNHFERKLGDFLETCHCLPFGYIRLGLTFDPFRRYFEQSKSNFEEFNLSKFRDFLTL